MVKEGEWETNLMDFHTVRFALEGVAISDNLGACFISPEVSITYPRAYCQPERPKQEHGRRF